LRLRLPALNETLTVRPREGEDGLSAYRSLASTSIGSAELRAVSDDTGDLVRYARAREGKRHDRAVCGRPAAGSRRRLDDRRIRRRRPFSAEHGDTARGA
jgi:hypothetical protein